MIQEFSLTLFIRQEISDNPMVKFEVPLCWLISSLCWHFLSYSHFTPYPYDFLGILVIDVYMHRLLRIGPVFLLWDLFDLLINFMQLFLLENGLLSQTA